LCARLAGAQTKEIDLIRLSEDSGSPRYLGLSGAFAGLGDDVNAIVSNPAALTRIPRTLDTALSVGRDWTSFVAVVSQPRPGLAVGAHLWGQAPRDQLGRGAIRDTPLERARLQEIGTAMAWRLPWEALEWVSVGAGFEGSWLALSPSDSLQGSDFAARFRVGVFFDPEARAAPRVGLSLRPSTTWTLTEAEAGEVPTGPAAVRIKTPGVLSGGVSWAYDFFESWRLLTTYQQDLVMYSDLEPPSGMDRPRDDWDFRLGLELSIPFGDCLSGCGSMVQIRGGVTNRAPVPYALDRRPERTAGHGPGRSADWAAGASVALPKLWKPGLGGGRFRLDAGWQFRTDTWLLGLSYRFPEAYRADLRRRKRAS
jgi:hypothetical protein